MTRMEFMEEAIKPIGLFIAFSILLHPYTYSPETLPGKRILVTDATSTLGRAIAYEYAKVKTLLMLTGANDTALLSVATRCKELGAAQVEVLVGDITDGDHQDELVQQTRQKLGGLDHLLLNHEAEDQSQAWMQTVANNATNLSRQMVLQFTSHVALTSKVLPMLKESEGHIGVVSSLVGKIPFPGQAPHSAGRAALFAFFPALRQELYLQRTGVSVTSVALGYVRSAEGKNALGTHNPFFGDSLTTSLEDAAEMAIIAVAQRKQEVSYPFMPQMHYGLYLLFPNWYEKFVPFYFNYS